MKPVIFREPPRQKVYRSYKNFDLEHFNIALKSEEYNEFETTFCSVLNKHAPIKVRILRQNNNSFMTENLTCTDLNLKIVSTNTALMKTVSLLRKTKQQYFKISNLNGLTEN